jgi:ABC-type transport system involved in multi-copper enzyme maturation permease subunit
MFSFLSAAFIAVRMILQEMEEKTVYLILSRPVTRPTYLLGRFFGIISVLASYIIIMAGALTLMLLVKGWEFNSYIILISFTVFLKVLIITSFAILLSLVSTSSASSFVSIFFLWALGHFAGELKYLNHLLKEAGIFITPLIRFIYYIIPNFNFLNYKDTFHVAETGFSAYFYPAGYAIFYSAVVITLSIIIFNKKEL